MKKEFPVLYSKASLWIATPIIIISAIIYSQKLITLSISEIYPLVISIFGISAALSGICYSMTSAVENESKSTSIYAGEKFLHSCLLLIQTLFLIYTKDELLASKWILSHSIIKSVISITTNWVIILLSSSAAWTWYYGFSELNSILWKNWKNRINNINEKTKSSNNK